MWIFITLLWRITSRVLRRLGWGSLLVPVAVLGVAVFGITLLTVAAVALAVILVVRRPGTAAGLLPVTLVCAGILGLALAAATPGMAVWTAMPFGAPARVAVSLAPYGPGAVVKYGAAPVQISVPGKAARGWEVLPRAGATVHKPLAPPGAAHAVKASPGAAYAVKAPPGPVYAVKAPPGAVYAVNAPPGAAYAVQVPPGAPFGPVRFWRADGLVTSLQQSGGKTVSFAKSGPPSGWIAVGKPGAPGPFGGAGPGTGLVPSWLLVPLALVMLTVGLWLMPRSLARLRERAGPLTPYLRQRVRETGWGLALVPVTVIGLSVFGVRPWTGAAVIAALVITIWWPKVAADLVPFVLVVLALRGFQLAAHWAALPAGASGPGVPYGFVTVSGRQSALAAGAEASALMAVGAWLVPRTIVPHLRATPDPDLAGRVQRLTETRGHAVDAAAAELRRIERDLHDGAQARLVALGMNLRAVERVLPTSPNAALALVAEARETSVRALNELRDLIRGICPPVLADRGLGHAVQALVLDTPLPTTLEIDLPGRLPPPVESACYFAVAEALANAVKHAGARSAHIRIRHSAGLLRIEVSDDGIGGADPALGTGLLGVERRLGTFDGILAVNSPPGGPTMIVMEMPCALSSPKTYSY
jgi:signal transduction histidine kinase